MKVRCRRTLEEDPVGMGTGSASRAFARVAVAVSVGFRSVAPFR